ncbi:unnamed protein product, partial [Rotaria sordida]
GLSTSITG